jgi:hypothetical protein
VLKRLADGRADGVGVLGVECEALLNGAGQFLEGREVAQMGGAFLQVLPEVLNWVVIRRITGQLVEGQAAAMLGDERLECRRGMLGRTILEHDDRVGGLVEHRLEEVAVGVGGEARGLVLPKETPRKVVDASEDLERLALATGRHGRLPWHVIVSREAESSFPVRSAVPAAVSKAAVRRS